MPDARLPCDPPRVDAGHHPDDAPIVQRFGRVRLLGATPIAPERLMMITDRRPGTRVVADAVVTRMALDRPQWRAEPGDPARRVGTVYDGDGRPVPVHAADLRDQTGLLIARADEPELAPARRASAERLPGRHVYAGDLKLHFGHFMLESLCRAWGFADRPKGAKLVFHGPAGEPGALLAPFMRFFLEPFGVTPDEVVIANRDLRVDELSVPDSQYDLLARADRGLAAAFARIRAYHAPAVTEDLPRRVYFSRRAIDAAALERPRRAPRTPRATRWALRKLVANDAAVEQAFAARGFAVVAPETLPLARQVALAANARVIAGLTGTALHHALFGGDRLRVVSVATRFSPNQVAIEQLKGLRSAHLFCNAPRDPDEAVTIDVDLLERGLGAINL